MRTEASRRGWRDEEPLRANKMKHRIECKRFNPLTVQKHLDQCKSLHSPNLLKTMYGSFKRSAKLSFQF